MTDLCHSQILQILAVDRRVTSHNVLIYISLQTNVHVVLESLNVTVRNISLDSDAAFAIVSHLELNKKYTIALHLLFDDPAGLHTQSIDFHLDGRCK